ncbi:MAG: HDOD domain-containing protein [Gammaproteobacteria bacterium]|jgi:HD-like signal output (HDOD) protein
MDTTTDPAFEFVKRLSQELARNDFDLPPFPDTALRVREALNDPDVSIEKLGKIVLSEPTLTARLMRMANSAMMHRGTVEITDIKTAISRVGLDMVQNAAVSLAANQAFNASVGSSLRDHLDTIRRHSTRVCALAYFLAKKVQSSGKPDEAMLAGLLHAIGKFYILTRADDFPELFANADALEVLLDEWHTGVGRAIVESWGFPEEIANAVDEYQLVDRERFGQADITDIVIVANLLARADEEPATEQPDLDQVPSLLRMKIDAETVRNLVRESEEEIRSMIQALAS